MCVPCIIASGAVTLAVSMLAASSSSAWVMDQFTRTGRKHNRRWVFNADKPDKIDDSLMTYSTGVNLN